MQTMKKVLNIPSHLLHFRMQLANGKLIQLRDLQYLDSHWYEINDLLMSCSAGQLVLRHDLCGGSKHFQTVDYIAILNGLLIILNGRFIFNKDILVSLIDDYSLFDSILKNNNIIKSFLHFRNNIAEENKDEYNRVLVHLIKKFPSIRSMNFMFHKVKGEKKCYITDFHMRKYM